MVNFRCQSDGIKDPVFLDSRKSIISVYVGVSIFLDSRKSIISVYVGEAYPEDTGI
jgi:hypothetical protein